MTDAQLMIIQSVIEGKLSEDFVNEDDLMQYTFYAMDLFAEKMNPCLPHHTYSIQ